MEPTPEERNWASGCHLAAFAGLLVPFGNVVGPLVVWLIKRESPFVDQHGKEAVNFQITVSIALFVAMLAVSVLVRGLGGGPFLLVIGGVFIFALVMIARAASQAGRGQPFEYPLSLRLVR